MAAWTAERQRSLSRASERAKDQARVDAAQAEFERRRRNTRAQLRETCTYWTQVARTENTALNRGYQQMACERLRQFR